MGKVKEISLDYLRGLAAKFDGELLSEKYVKFSEKLLWKCKYGHEFPSIWYTVKKGHWCSTCGGNKKLSLKDARELAASKDGYCLSEEYTNTTTLLKWQCKNGHNWNATYGNVKYSTWCGTCKGMDKHTIQDAQKLAQDNDGYCLSEKYVRAKEYLNWKCKLGHEWEASFDSVRRGSWCSMCSKSKTEKRCRDAFEFYLKRKFEPIRPHWLMGFKGRPLELDGYCAELNLAFEYNGAQHYKVVDKFKTTEELVEYQKQKDKLKVDLCSKNNVKLIVISELPQVSKYKVFKMIEEMLKKEKLL